MSRIYRTWLALPLGLRTRISRCLRWLPLPLGRLHTMAGAPCTDGFTTLTPDTPPAVERCLESVARSGIRGDYYEFGLFRGYTFWRAQQAAKRLGLSDMRFWGFDSFSGLPPISGPDAGTREFQAGDYACSCEQVRGYLDKYGVDWRRTSLIEGYFDSSLTLELPVKLGMRPAALVLIDCDLYQSTVLVLAFVERLFQPGTLLLFDDWNCFGASDEMGERRAFREFLTSHPHWRAEPSMSFGWHGQGFVLRGNR